MSDPYDSLEDNDQDEYSCDLLNLPESESTDSITDCDEVHNYSFFLNPDKNPPKHSSAERLRQLFIVTHTQSENILPKIKRKREEGGLTPVSNFIVDVAALNQKGLQLNQDGSFTRSPRPEEKLPFVTREYRNLRFERNKHYLADRKKSVGKNISGEVLIKKIGEISPAKENQTYGSTKQYQPNHNMTDSMKERLLENFEEKKVIKKYDPKGTEQLDKTKKKIGGNLEKELKKKKFPFQKNILPDIINAKPKLNYSERHQLESGFNPLSLRPEGKKLLDESSRSTYGDSVHQDLPEISSRVVSYEDLHNLEEEMFYNKIIQREKALKGTPRTCVSEEPIEPLQLNGITKGNSFREHLMFLSKKNPRSRSSAKSTVIDMPTDSNNTESNSRKISHYCSNNASKNQSKVELALKAKTYGYLVNARNIFKMKVRSERKLNAMRKEKSELSIENLNNRYPTSKMLLKQNSLPSNCLKPFKPPPLVSPSKQSLKTQKTTDETQAYVILPEVTGSKLNRRKITTEMFNQINSCLRKE